MSGTLADRVAAGCRDRLQLFEVGDRFDSVSEVCDRFDVSTATAVRSLGTLVKEGLLDAQHGVGYFVTAHPRKASPATLAEKVRDIERALAELRAMIHHLEDQ